MNITANSRKETTVEGYGSQERDWEELVPQIKKYVDQNIKTINSMSDVEERFEVNQRELSEQFFYRTGIHPKTFIARVRFKLLRKILGGIGENIKYYCVAIECGYKSVNAMYAAVKRATGLTIRQFHRKLLKSKSRKVDKFVDNKVGK